VRKDSLTIPRDIETEKATKIEKVPTLPHLVSIEIVFALVMLAVVFLWASWVNAPLEAAADPNHSPNPAKAAWYFMGIQELLLHFHPVVGAIIIPALGLGALVALPYLRFDSDSEGIWFRSRKGRRMAWFAAVTALVVTPALVILDEVAIDFPAMLPTLPTLISNGLLPLMILLLGFLLYGAIIKALFNANQDETRQALFVLLVVGFVILTVIGVAFRGEGMALVFPWEVL